MSVTYNSRRYRNLNIARMALFLDWADVKAKPGEEQRLFGGQVIRPDFFLVDLNTWLLVEPLACHPDALNSLLQASLRRVLIAPEVPVPFFPVEEPCWPTNGVYTAVTLESMHWLKDCYWCECPACGALDVQPGGRVELMACDCGKAVYGSAANVDTPKIRNAALGALALRGED